MKHDSSTISWNQLGNARELAQRKANVLAIDCSECSIDYCTEQAKISTAIAWLQKIPLFLFWELAKQT